MPDSSYDALFEESPPAPRRLRDPLDLIAHYESGGRNIRQQVVPPGGGYNPSVGRVTGPSTAQGPWQITNSTWKKRAPNAGVDINQYPTAMSAPVEVQRRVAQQMFNETGYRDWAPYNAGLRAALRRGEGEADGSDAQQQSQPSNPYDALFDSPGQTPPPTERQTTALTSHPPAPPKQPPATSVPRSRQGGGIFSRREVQEAVRRGIRRPAQPTVPIEQALINLSREVTASTDRLKQQSQRRQQRTGMIEQGNIDLTNRPRVRNADGSVSTVRSISVNVDGREVLIPTVGDDGRILSDQEAIQQYRQTSRHLGVFRSPQAATRYAKRLHEDQARQLNTASPASGMGELRRAERGDEARTQRLLELQREETARAAGPPTLRYMGTYPGRESARAARIAAERLSAEEADTARRQRLEPEVSRLTDYYRQQIRQAQNRGIGPEQWLNEMSAKGVAGLLELGSGVIRSAKLNPLAFGAEDTSDRIAVHAEALQRAAEAEGADRNYVSQATQNVLAGTVSTAPEMVATSVGVPAPVAFGAGGASRSLGRGERPEQIAKSGLHGATTGAVFEIPAALGLQRPLAKVGTIGVGTGAVEAASGQPLSKAIEAGATNAFLAGAGEIGRGGRRQPSSLARGLERETPRERVEADAEIAARLRGERARQPDEAAATNAIDNVARDTRTEQGNVSESQRAAVRENVPPMGEGPLRRGGEDRPVEDYLDEPQTKVQPPAPDTVRLYRADHSDAPEAQGKGWSTSLDYVSQKYGAGAGSGTESVWYIDVPKKSLDEAFGDWRSVGITDTQALQASGIDVQPRLYRRVNEPQIQTKPPVEAQRETIAQSSVAPLAETESQSPATGFQSKTFANISEVAPFINNLPESVKNTYHSTLVRDSEFRRTLEEMQGVKQFSREWYTYLGEHHQAILNFANRFVRNAQPSARTEPQPQRSSVTEPVTEPTLTSAAKARVDRDRAVRGADPLPATPPTKTDTQLLEQARRANEQTPDRPARLAREVIATPRALSDVETVQLDLHQQGLKNRHATLLREIADTADPAQIEARRGELAQLEDEFNLTEQAWRLSGTEKGRALRSQQIAINENYDLLSLTARAKAAKGRELTPGERARYEKLAQDYEAAIQQRDAALAKAEEAELQRQLSRVTRQRKRGESRAILDQEWAELKEQFAQARKEIDSTQPSGLAGLDPEGKLTVLIAKMARNRARAGANSAAQLVDDVYNAVRAQLPTSVTRDDIRDIVTGFGFPPDAQHRRRQTQLLNKYADLEQRLATGNFTPTPPRQPVQYTRETAQLQKRVEELKAKFNRELYLAQRGVGGKIADTLVGLGSVPKTMLSMGDLSAILRQGGFGSVTHPILSYRAAQDMLRAFSDAGFRNVEMNIKDFRDSTGRPVFDEARTNGVEFTGIDRSDPHLNRREEGYLGREAVSKIPVVGKVADFSERTFVSFLDSQRIRLYAKQAEALRAMKLTPEELQRALKFQAKLINMATGRGNLGRAGNQAAPLLNLAFFSPRLVASRVQLLNKMLNPVAWATAPKGARKLMLIDNAKYLGFTALTLGLIRQSGLAEVDLDPESSDFLKVKVGNTRYDTLTGLQQPLRFMIRLSLAVKGGETYSGASKGEIVEGFVRSKANPPAGSLYDFIRGGNPLTGEEFSLKREGVRLLEPLPLQDFREAIKEDGYVRGIAETLPVLVGIGAQTYKGSAEKPVTDAEKLARRMVSRDLPRKFRPAEQIELDTKRGQLRAAARRGEDVTQELGEIAPQLTTGQERAITDAVSRSRLQEDFNRLTPENAATVYGVASPAEREQLRPILERKASNLGNLPEDRQRKLIEKLRGFGIEVRPRLRSNRPRLTSTRPSLTR